MPSNAKQSVNVYLIKAKEEILPATKLPNIIVCTHKARTRFGSI